MCPAMRTRMTKGGFWHGAPLPQSYPASLDDFLALVPQARASEIEKTVLYYQEDDRKRAADGMRKAGLRE